MSIKSIKNEIAEIEDYLSEDIGLQPEEISELNSELEILRATLKNGGNLKPTPKAPKSDTSIMDTITSPLEAIGEAIAKPVGTFVDAITNPLEKVGTAVANPIDAVAKAVTNPVQRVGEAVTRVITKGKARRPAAEKRERKPQKAAKYTGQWTALDQNGDRVSVGNHVRINMANGITNTGIITAVQKQPRGGHSVRYDVGGKTKTSLFSASKVKIIDAPTHHSTGTHQHHEPMPAAMIKSAVKAKKADCADGAYTLITPTETVVFDFPQESNPKRGDKVLLNADSTPLAVIKGSEVAKHFTPKPEDALAVQMGEDGESVFGPNQAAVQQEDAATVPDRKIEKKRPKTAQECDLLKENARPAAKTLLEGMRQAYNAGDTVDKVLRVYYHNASHKITFEIKKYDWLQMFGRIAYFTVCADTAKMGKVKDFNRKEHTLLFGESIMKDFYRHPNENLCKQLSAELYGKCYRSGACDTETKKDLYRKFITTCNHRTDEITRSYTKYLHERTRLVFNKYDGEKSYYQLFQEQIDAIKKKTK